MLVETTLTDLLEYLAQILTTFSKIITYASSMQSDARNKLINELQEICSNVESTYSDVLSRLRSVKDKFNEPEKLSKELRNLHTDKEMRNSFKPNKLCGNVDHLIWEFESYLDPIKYSVDIRKLGRMKERLTRIGSIDQALYSTYDGFTRNLDDIATEISSLLEQKLSEQLKERTQYAQSVISNFEDVLVDLIEEMHKAKDQIIR